MADMKQVHKFAVKWYDKFSDKKTNFTELVDQYMADDCEALGFEMDCGHRLNASDRACGYSFAYKSVIGTGVIAPVEDVEEKKRALAAIMVHYAPEKQWVFTDEQAGAVSVFRLDIDSLRCKAHP